MDIDATIIFGTHGLHMIFLEAEKQGFSNFDKTFFIDENLLWSQSFMTNSTRV